MRKTWQTINAKLNRRKKIYTNNKLKDQQNNNRIAHNPSRIPNITNKYYSSVGGNSATRIP